MSNKISIIGAGNVGAICAYNIAQKNLGEIILFDKDINKASAKALDINHAICMSNQDMYIKPTNQYYDIKDSNIVIVASGKNCVPGIDRIDLLKNNINFIKELCRNLVLFCPKSIVLVITNPVDVMTYTILKQTNFKKNKVFGLSGALDSARYKYYLAKKIRCSIDSIRNCFVIGEHGQSMVPLTSQLLIKGKKIFDTLSLNEISEVKAMTINSGLEIVNLLKREGSKFAPGSATLRLVESIIKDKKDMFQCSAFLEGEYNYKNIAIGVPVIIGANGVEKIIEVCLNEIDEKLFQKSVNVVTENLKVLEAMI